VTLALFPAIASAVQNLNIQEGLWQVTTEMGMQGLPIGMHHRVTTRCITRKDLEDPAQTVLRSSHGHCTVTNYKIGASTATWSMVCTGRAAITGTGQMTYTRTHYEGSVRMQMQSGEARNMEMVTSFSGKRLGECR
jgi:hypothetical protein